MIENITDSNKNTLALIIRSNYEKEGIHFFTQEDFSQQLAYMHHKAGHIILPHIHNKVERTVLYTKEILVIKQGKMRCDFYTENKEYIKSCIIKTGDVILLASGGHGFECLEETKFFEIKQGPYDSKNDKTRFEPVSVISL